MSKTALIDAVKQLDLDAVRRILERKPALRDFRSEQGFNLLQFCCARPVPGDATAATRQLQMAKWLVDEAGFDPLVTFTTKPGDDGEEDVAVLSLVFFAVARAQNDRLARYFLGLGALPRAEFAAVWWANWEILKDLVDRGCPLDVVVGATPLHMAIGLLQSAVERRPDEVPRRVKTLKELLRLGANPNIPDIQKGRTSLHVALEKECDVDIFKLLLRHGADPDLPDRDGRTVRGIASRKRDKRYALVLRP